MLSTPTAAGGGGVDHGGGRVKGGVSQWQSIIWECFLLAAGAAEAL